MTQRPIFEPCPLCNSKNVVLTQYGMESEHESIDMGSYAVSCDSCGCCGPEISPRQRAIDAWNKRVPSPGELHWRNNHASVVAKSRVLIERLDMPLERVQAFKYIDHLQKVIVSLETEVNRLQGDDKK